MSLAGIVLVGFGVLVTWGGVLWLALRVAEDANRLAPVTTAPTACSMFLCDTELTGWCRVCGLMWFNHDSESVSGRL